MAYDFGAALRRRLLPDFGAIPTFARDYLRVLIAEYNAMPKPPGYTDPPDVAAVKAKTDDRVWLWADVVTIENAILNVTADSDMPATLIRWRERYRDIVGDTRYAFYAQSGPPDPKTAPVADLRADVRGLADRIHYLLATVTAREKMRNRLALFLGLVMIVAVLIVLGPALQWSSQRKDVPWILSLFRLKDICSAVTYCVQLSAFELAALAGVFGGFVSVQQRLQTATNVDPFFKRLELSAGWASIVLIAPLVGMVFAVVLFEVFVAGAVSGALVPNFVSVDPKAGDVSSFKAFDLGSTPKSPQDWAKLGVWSFIAGFAERFVPDVLSRLADMKNLFTETKS
ncbi:MAG TPA: hypothetical protein VGD01_03400 [Candidatus Elarobacter sp.]